MKNTGKRIGAAKIFLTLLVVILVLGIVVAGFYFADKKGLLNLKQEGSETSAVFLANGQVYFGKILSKGGSYVIMENVYYLQATKPAETQAKDEAGTAQPSKVTMKPLPLTGTVLGPTSRIEINRDNVLYIQRLREDSKMLQALQKGGSN